MNVNMIFFEYERIFGDPMTKHEVNFPWNQTTTQNRTMQYFWGVKNYQKMIIYIQWDVSQGRIEITSTTVTMAIFGPDIHKVYFYKLVIVYTLFHNCKNKSSKINIEVMGYSRYHV